MMKKPKNPHAAALGRLGGSKGGKKAAANLTPEERKERARKAVEARWAKRKRKKGRRAVRTTALPRAAPDGDA